MVDDKNGLVCEVRASLLHKRCWYASCGGAALTTFQLAIGDKIPRSVMLRNTAHSEDFRTHEGEANLLVWCTWRLDGIDAPVTSSDDGVDRVVEELNSLVGRDVVNVVVDLPGWDLHLDFTGGMRLHVFCDHVPGDPSFNGNWLLSLKNKRICIGVGSKCKIEPREGSGQMTKLS